MFLLLLHKYFKRCIYALSVILFFATLIFNGKRHKAKGKVLFRKTIGMRNWAIPEKIQTGKGGGWGHTFLKKNLGICRLVTLPLDISDKMKLHPWKFHKFVSHPKTRTYGNSAWLFLDYPWKFQHYFTEFPHSIFSIPLEIPYSQPSLFVFFWNNPLLSRKRLCKKMVLIWGIIKTDKMKCLRSISDRKIQNFGLRPFACNWGVCFALKLPIK